MILLDTHVLLWLDSGSNELGTRSRKVIDAAFAREQLAVSAISFWEVTMLQEKNRLSIAQDLAGWRRELLDSGLVEMPVDGDVGILAGALRNFHGDPADRMIVAATLRHGAELLTADRRILDWNGRLLRHDARQ